MNDITDLSPTIVPKSDQKNADELLSGPQTITITRVVRGTDPKQPVFIFYEGEDRPFKPCLTMRKMIMLGWGKDGTKWVGRSMTIYNDPEVMYGGNKVGGIRISHMTDIKPQGIEANLNATKGRKATHTIKLLEVAKPVVLADVLAQIEAASSRAEMEAAKAQAALLPEADFHVAGEAYAARRRVLATKASPPPPPASDDAPMPFAQVMDLIAKAATPEALEMAAGFIEGVPSDQQQELRDAVEAKNKAVLV